MNSAQTFRLSLVNFDSLSKLAQCAWNSLRENKDMSESKVKERVELGREAEFFFLGGGALGASASSGHMYTQSDTPTSAL